MTTFDLTISERHLDQLQHLLFTTPRTEGAAYVLCGQAAIAADPWSRRARRKLLVREVVPIGADALVSAGPQHVTWNTRGYIALMHRARAEGLVLGIAHSHPGGAALFSQQDDRNEAELFRTMRVRNGPDALLLSMLMGMAREVRGRVWQAPSVSSPLDLVRVVGSRFRLHHPDATSASPAALVRQALAFGDALNRDLRSLRVAVIGCGGTGSATAMLLARMGVGQILLIDDDIVEVTNLNRLHGARQSDADAMRPKVDVVAAEIASMGLGVRAIPIRAWVGDPKVRGALTACDVIFGCTDDHAGRLFLNRFSTFYLTPVIDMGLAIRVADDPSRGLADLSGRVTVLAPGAPCLLCRGTIDVVRARDENLRRQNPEEHERRKREAYVRGEGNPSPAVVTFTTEVACMAVNDFVHRLVGFRRRDMGWEIRRRFHVQEDRATGAHSDPDCPICGSLAYHGHGDVDPFLDMV